MSGVELRSVKALVVARVREFALHPIRALFATLAPAGFALGQPQGMPSVILAIEMGFFVGLFAGVRLTPRASDDGGSRSLTTRRAELVPALPVSTGTRVLAWALVAAIPLVGYASAMLIRGVLRPDFRPSVAANLGGLLMGMWASRVLLRFTQGRFFIVLRRLHGSLVFSFPRRFGDTGVVLWTALPKTLFWTLLSTPLLAGFFAYMTTQVVHVPTDHHWRLMARFILCAPAFIVWFSALLGAYVPMAFMAVSRRSIARAELALSLVALGLSGMITLGVTQFCFHDVRLTRGVAHLFVMFGASAAMVRVAYARTRRHQPGNTRRLLNTAASVCLGIAYPLVAFSLRSRVLDTISVVAFVLAALLAYTAPNTPLSTSPFRTDWFAFLRRSPATTRGK